MKRLLLVPGLGCDRRLFVNITPPTGWEIITLPFLLHQKGESLRAYSRRMARIAEEIAPDAVGGSSFGGMIAQEVAAALGKREVIVIDSVRSGRDVPPNMFKFFMLMTTYAPSRCLQWTSERLFTRMMRGNRVDEELWPIAREMLDDSPWGFRRWCVRAILGWEGLPPDAGIRIRQIHGENDEMFPLKRLEHQPERVAPGAGHMLPLGAPGEVSRFLEDVLAERDPAPEDALRTRAPGQARPADAAPAGRRNERP